MGMRATEAPVMGEAAMTAQAVREVFMAAMVPLEVSEDSEVLDRARARAMRKIPIFELREIIFATVITKKPGPRWIIWRTGTGAQDGITTVPLRIPGWGTMWRRWSMRREQLPWSRTIGITGIWYSSTKAAGTGMSSGRRLMAILPLGEGISV